MAISSTERLNRREEETERNSRSRRRPRRSRSSGCFRIIPKRRPAWGSVLTRRMKMWHTHREYVNLTHCGSTRPST